MAYGNTGGGTGAAGGAEPEVSDSLRTFGAVVHALREHAGLSREEFGALVGYSKHTIASIEQGRRMPDRDFVQSAEPVLGNTGALRKAAPHLSRQAGLASWFVQWARLEATAVSLYTYECRVIPGLLQTEAYARAVSLDVPPLPDPEELEQRIAARMARQELLAVTRKPPTAFSFIVEQAVLERHTGGEAVTRELLDHLIALIESHWNVEFQVMPLRRPTHAGLDGPLQLAETPEHRWYGYSEGQNNGRLISDPKEISVLHQRCAKLRSQALNPEDSLGLLKRMRGAL
ncbi:helix-turn-helix protein [Streptomyces sp. KhCrAH-43]|uniref:helix-turn-helix domain-containing protein n=1 Tax=unclassified Streptomyces TaxID=2593676 RepID=UPI0003A69E04|nr:helix-turn-helix transcriptional regulator [Streptomyces sp. KhCrAH-43]MYS37968.1 helix-turn-helix domain-containing protein [Streptomyces sp. SID4920]MYX66155.1 helix-turn-helix domain-containing protein [Streptomyces sp. SID8373]RAJ67639.1 helix-turn-helix protein [Streptomyces sp. KhCrAH-43]